MAWRPLPGEAAGLLQPVSKLRPRTLDAMRRHSSLRAARPSRGFDELWPPAAKSAYKEPTGTSLKRVRLRLEGLGGTVNDPETDEPPAGVLRDRELIAALSGSSVRAQR